MTAINKKEDWVDDYANSPDTPYCFMHEEGVDDILKGGLVKVNDKYFRHDATEPTWIPLSQCGLEHKGEE